MQQQQAMMMMQQTQAAMMMQQQAMMMQSAMMGQFVNPMALAMMGGSAISTEASSPVQETAASTERKSRAKGADDSSGDEDDDLSKGTSNNVNHPHYRPPDMEQQLGLTDRRFEGYVHRWFEDQGFGFVHCEELTKKFGSDAFLHRTQKKHFARGEFVTFAVFMNYRGKPQATELRKCNKTKRPPPPG